MLKSIGKPELFMRLGTRVCVCMRKKRLGRSLRERIRPKVFGGYACWCDKPDTGT